MDGVRQMSDTLQHCNTATGEIAAYIDGELVRAREMELALHLASCNACTDELNLQKHLLHGLEFGLRDNADLDLPEDFTKVVVANAESTVAGLRRPRERFNMIFICGGLSLFILLSFGVGAVVSMLDQFKAIGAFFGHLVYDFLLAIVVILRSGASQVHPETVMALLMAGVFGFAIFLARKVLLGRLRS